MDESHRLKPMVENYDRNLFNLLYKNTEQLRAKLAWEIDPRKYGVDYDEMLSWFDVKFLFAFNRYYNDERCSDNREQKLKAYIINSLQMYKRKIVLDSYKGKQTLTNRNSNIDITEVYNYEELLIEEIEDDSEDLITQIKTYFKERLSEEAYFLFELELNPPPYITSQYPDKERIPKLTTEVILDFLEIPCTDEAKDYIKTLHREIKEIKDRAQAYYNIA